MIALGVTYYAAAKLGQSLRYTASVAAIWPPAGLGIAALYLFGVRWWPGILLGEIAVNLELLPSLPVAALLGQQTGNMAEIVVGALLLRRLIGPRAKLDRVGQVGGMLPAVGIATAISATCGTLAMAATGVIDAHEMRNFWRTWWLGDTAGALVVLPAVLAWASRPAMAWRRLRTWKGGLMVVSVTALSVIAASTEEPATYIIFPGLIWAAFRFGPPGATLAVAISTFVVVVLTAHDLGPFSNQPIDPQTLSTQLYIVVTALTTLFLAAVVSERERAAAELAETKRREGEQAVAERHRIARDLHDSVAQALFSTLLQVRMAQKQIRREGGGSSDELARSLTAIAELTRGAQSEIRNLVVALRDPVEERLAAALGRYAALVAGSDGLKVAVEEPDSRRPLSRRVEMELYAIGREALANVVKHAGARSVSVVVEADRDRLVLRIRDDGRGVAPAEPRPGHFGRDSIHSRAAEIDARLQIDSTPGQGTTVTVTVDAPAESQGSTNTATTRPSR